MGECGVKQRGQVGVACDDGRVCFCSLRDQSVLNKYNRGQEPPPRRSPSPCMPLTAVRQRRRRLGRHPAGVERRGDPARVGGRKEVG